MGEDEWIEIAESLLLNRIQFITIIEIQESEKFTSNLKVKIGMKSVYCICDVGIMYFYK